MEFRLRQSYCSTLYNSPFVVLFSNGPVIKILVLTAVATNKGPEIVGLSRLKGGALYKRSGRTKRN